MTARFFALFWLWSTAPHAFAQAVQRIVSLSPTMTEIVCALDSCESLVAVTRFDDFPASVTHLPRVGGFTDPSIEAIVKHKPTWVLMTRNSATAMVSAALHKLSIHHSVYQEARITDFEATVRDVAAHLNKQPQGEALIARWRADWQMVQREAFKTQLSAVIIYGHHPLVIAGKESLAQDFFNHAGLKNSYEGQIRYPALSLEALIALRPHLLIDLSMNEEEFTKSQTPWPATLKACRLALFDPALLRLGPRFPQASLQLVRSLHALIEREPCAKAAAQTRR